MNYSVLVVDDSIFHRRRLKEIIEQDQRLKVVDAASNGKEAIQKVKTLKPDIITMDVEMPVLDGIAAVKNIMANTPTPILMFSSLTSDGAQQTLDALDAGALDFLPKEFDNKFKTDSDIGMRLRSKILSLVRQRHTLRRQSEKVVLASNAPKVFLRSGSIPEVPKADIEVRSHIKKSNKRYKILAIGSSTGGPVALQKVLSGLPSHFPVPILLVQHMPGTFTEAFAQRLNQSCAIEIKLATHGEELKPGVAYLAPGGRQMLLTGTSQTCKINITDVPETEKVLYKPSVNHTLSDVARVYGGDVLALILTGMGSDGEQGCAKLKRLGATIWAQDQTTSVVYGMPSAVTKAGLVPFNIPLDAITTCLKTEML